MNYPPSLPDDVLARAFRASNGELGVLPSDADRFLTACETDQIEVLGWELWLVDHVPEPQSGELVTSPGRWSGLIPMLDTTRPAVFEGSGNAKKSREEIAALKLSDSVDLRWLPYIRCNFTLDL